MYAQEVVEQRSAFFEINLLVRLFLNLSVVFVICGYAY